MHHHHHHGEEYGADWMIAVALMDGPTDINTIVSHYDLLVRRFGFFLENIGNGGISEDRGLADFIEERLVCMEQKGWVTKASGDSYTLTDTGMGEAVMFHGELKSIGKRFKRIMSPETVTVVTSITHAILALLKIPAALVSGSIGLLNDGMDTLLDSISSLIIYFGVKKEKERIANIILIGIMTVTGGYTLYEAIMRVFTREPVEVSAFAVSAAVLSGIFCTILMFYQRIVGKQRSSSALITLSLDSRNHLITAGGVLAGLIAMWFDFIWLDIFIGLAVALIICKTAVELIIELFSDEDEQAKFSKYQVFGFDTMKRRQLSVILLEDVRRRDDWTRTELYDHARGLYSLDGNPFLGVLDLEEVPHLEEHINKTVDSLYGKSYIRDGEDGIEMLPEAETFLRDWKKRQQEYQHSQIPGIILGGISFLILTIAAHRLFAWLGWHMILPVSVEELLSGNTVLVIGQYLISGMIFVLGFIQLRAASHQIHHVRDEHRKSRRLVTTGAYRLCRHPMYAGMIMTRLALAAAVGNVVLSGLMILLTFVQIINAVWEEKRLIMQFSDAFISYQSRVPRLFTPLQWGISILLFGWMVAEALFF